MRSGHIVTTIEVLSPGNKRGGEGRQQYLLKRNACLLGERNFVELDLLRGGTRMPPANDYPAGEYFVTLFRMTRPGKCGLWPIGLRDRLPTVPIPLLPGEGDLRLDLVRDFPRSRVKRLKGETVSGWGSWRLGALIAGRRSAVTACSGSREGNPST